MRNPIELMLGDLGDKRKWLAYKARVKKLPAGYQEAAGGIERYAMCFGPVDDGATLVRMFGDLAELLEAGAADNTPIRTLVGEDPADFVETFLDTYRGSGRSWVEKEQHRLAATIDKAVQEQDRQARR